MNSWDLYLHQNDEISRNRSEVQKQQSFDFPLVLSSSSSMETPDKKTELLAGKNAKSTKINQKLDNGVCNESKNQSSKKQSSKKKSQALDVEQKSHVCVNAQTAKAKSTKKHSLVNSRAKKHSTHTSQKKLNTDLKLLPDLSHLTALNVKKTNSVLPFNAWSVGELSEIRCKKEENIFHLLLPLLSELSSQNRWITLIAPPAGIDKKLFAYHGIDVSKALLIHPKENVDDTTTMNKALKNGTSGIVLIWVETLASRFVAQWRKSVKQGDCRGVIINHDQREHSSSSVALSLDVSSSDDVITITSSQMFGRKNGYCAKRSFPIVNMDETLITNVESETFSLIN